MLDIQYNENYQLFFLKYAINELSQNEKNKVKSILIDHYNGCNYINNIKIPLTFPLYLLNYVNSLNKNKEIEYNFLGSITNKRNWIKKYNTHNSIIKSSNYGRNSKIKYKIDNNYYNTMCKSKFTLTPTGDCPWSYRFFEAIMCLSIPILENNSNDIYMKDYYCYLDKDEHIYDETKAIENYKKFINSHHFLKNINYLTFN